jgi:hypothetical protein
MTYNYQSKKSSSTMSIVLSCAVSSITLILLLPHLSFAQLNGIANYTGSAQPNAIKNFTGSIEITSKIRNLMKSQAHISLTNSTEKALAVIGPNSYPSLNSLVFLRGFLVYSVTVTSPDNISHRVIVDAGTGKILSVEQIFPPPSKPSNQNWTGSFEIGSKILELMKDSTRVNLIQATNMAMSTIGPNSFAYFHAIAIIRGFLVYDILVIDQGNASHRVIVDAGNGNILSNEQLFPPPALR